MLRIAAGETLPDQAEGRELNGSAIEARIYAEDPTRGFLPSTGRLVHYRPPKLGIEGEVIATTRGVEEGGEISGLLRPDDRQARYLSHRRVRSGDRGDGGRRSMPSPSTASATTFHFSPC